MDEATVPDPGVDSFTSESPGVARDFGLQANRARNKTGILLACAVVAAAAMAVHMWGRTKVTVVAVERGTAVDAVYGSGTIEAVDRVTVKARVAGPISRLFVREGGRVTEGDSLAWIDVPELRHDVVRGESDVAAARGRMTPQTSALRATERVLEAQLSQARLELQRAEGSAKLGMSAEQDLERAELQIALLEGQLATNGAQQTELAVTSHSDARRAEAGLESLRARASDAHVRSPIAGVVLERYVELGEFVSMNQDLVRVGDIKRLQVEAVVDEADIGRVRVGMPAAVRGVAFQNRTLRAEVRRISPAAESGQRGFRVDLDLLDELDGLRPGMSAECNIILVQRDGALLVPADAAHGDHVWVVASDGIVHRRSVKSGLRDIGRVELTQGVTAGELLVVGSESGLVDGQTVSPRGLDRDVAGR